MWHRGYLWQGRAGRSDRSRARERGIPLKDAVDGGVDTHATRTMKCTRGRAHVYMRQDPRWCVLLLRDAQVISLVSSAVFCPLSLLLIYLFTHFFVGSHRGQIACSIKGSSRDAVINAAPRVWMNKRGDFFHVGGGDSIVNRISRAL